MLNVKVTQPGRTAKSTHVYEGTIESAPKIKTTMVVKNQESVVLETDEIEAVTHHVKANSYTVKVGRHKLLVEVLASSDSTDESAQK